MPNRLSTPIALICVLILSIVSVPAAAIEIAPSEDQIRFFEAKIRPVLLDQCTKCHGPQKQKAGLRLDSREAILNGGETGPAIIPGKPQESLLVTAIRHEADGPKMPPSKKLPAPAIADLTRWVEMGAPWPAEPDTGTTATPVKRRGEFQITEKDRAHWAFQPVRRPVPPVVKKPAWMENPIDRFILAGLENKGMEPNPPATRRELIRRATYDLTGLPPTPEEVEVFLKDQSPTAYASLIDRLLASPRYGEKWGRHWLDLVRFAETNSYERDGVKPNAWRYRDYVIRAFNNDLPYDRFVREQLAGDELPDQTNDSLIATGYYRLGIWDDEPSDRELALYDGYDDLVATTSQVFLGLTVDCARCHDHKLDPIPQKDYYRLVSFFRNVNPYRNGGPTDEVAIFADENARLAHAQTVRDAEQKRNAIRSEMAKIEADFAEKSGKSRNQISEHVDIDDLRYRFYRDTWEKLPVFDTLKPETVGSLPDGRFDLSAKTRDDAFGFVFEGSLIVPKAGRYTFFLDSDDGSRLSVAGKSVVDLDGIHMTGHEKSATVDLPAGRVPIRLDYFQLRNAFGLSVAWTGPSVPRRSLTATPRPKTRDLAKVPLQRRIIASGASVLGAETWTRYQKLKAEFEGFAKTIVPPDRALSISEAGPEAPETTVLLRGNPQSKGDRVEPEFLQVLGGRRPNIPKPAPGAKSTGRRRALADWIVAPDNPLTSRVIANRVWQHHFGRGIVRSSSNFGLQGDKPTHPELLDWLASELIANGWRLKPLHRVIMLSNAYQMSSRPQEKALASDPTNDHLWRFEMRRLGAEEIRDSILAVTGTLNLKMYGPGVYPTIPPEVLAGQSVPGSGWGRSSPEDEARRSIYIHVKRSLLTPILESFDFAETDRSSPNRFATTQPTQALAMLNGTFMNLQAEALAKRLRDVAGTDRKRQVERALTLVTTRPPTVAEINRGVALIADLESKGIAPDAALRSFCLVALNLNEFLYID
jgi:hypothetical protein